MREFSDRDWGIIRSLALFAGLDDATLRRLLARAMLVNLPAHAVVFHQEDPATSFYAVLRGWVTLTRESEDGNPTVIGVFTVGESFAEAAILSSRRYPVTARVVESARLLAVPADDFLHQLRSNAEVALNMLASMSRHMRHLVQQLEQQRAKSAPQRLGSFLLRMHPSEDRPGLIRLPYEKSILAGRLGMKPETLSRALARLREVGVQTEGKDLFVADFEALRRFSGAALVD